MLSMTTCNRVLPETSLPGLGYYQDARMHQFSPTFHRLMDYEKFTMALGKALHADEANI